MGELPHHATCLVGRGLVITLLGRALSYYISEKNIRKHEDKDYTIVGKAQLKHRWIWYIT
jgi:hypothetical protein